MFVQNFIKRSAAVHELSCWQRERTQLKTIRRRYRGHQKYGKQNELRRFVELHVHCVWLW